MTKFSAADPAMKDKPLQIAVITTEYTPKSHADVIVSRWLEPRPTDPQYGWTTPTTHIASLFVAQKPEGRDLSVGKSLQFGVPIFDTIEGALTLGGEKLAIDAVFLIAEHGDYPENELQQKLYPRKEFFDQVLDVFARSGRKVPIFFDKHLSWNLASIQEMYDRIKTENLAVFGGSSSIWSPLKPDLDLPDQPDFGEVVAVYYNALESYLFHSLEYVQALVSKRPGGETGVAEIVAWKNEEVWAAMDRGEFSKPLLAASGYSVSEEAGQALEAFMTKRDLPVYAFQLRHNDGLKVTHLMQHDVVRKWFLAAKLKSSTQISATCQQTAGEEHFFPHFARFCRAIEDFILAGQPSAQMDRLYFTSLATALSMQALAQSGKPLPTPELKNIVYA